MDLDKLQTTAGLDLKAKRVIVRADLNVPVKDGKVTSDARIRASLPTIKLALDKGAKVFISSHLGRPEEGVYAEGMMIVVGEQGEIDVSGRSLGPVYANDKELRKKELIAEIISHFSL